MAAAAAAANALRALKITDIPTYAHEKPGSWPAYLMQIRLLFAAGDVVADRRVAYLAAAMRGQALTQILSVFGPDGIPPDADWDNLIIRLNSMFNEPEALYQRNQRLNGLDLAAYQSMTAGVAAYHAAIATCTTPVTPAENCGFFANFTRRFAPIYIEMDRHIRAQPNGTVDAMIALLYSLQPLFAAGPSAPPAAAGSAAAAVGVEASSAWEARIAALEAGLRYGSPRGGRVGGPRGGPRSGGGGGGARSRAPFSGNCFRCGQPGHMQRDCRAAPIKGSHFSSVSLSTTRRQLHKTQAENVLVSAVNAPGLAMEVGVPVGARTVRARVLFDTGSLANVVSSAWVHSACIDALARWSDAPTQFIFANGERAWSTKELKSLELPLGELRSKVAHLRVAPQLMDGVDIILGMPWFRASEPQVHWGTGSMLVGGALVMGSRDAFVVPSTGPPSCVLPAPAAQSPLPPEVVVSAVSADEMRDLLHSGDFGASHAIWVCSTAAASSEPTPGGIAVGCTDNERAEVERLIRDFADVFPNELPPGVPASDVVHEIHLEEGAAPPFSRPFRLSAAESAEVSRQVAEFIRQGIVRPSSGPYGAPVLLVRKKDGSLRLCIDYRRLNELTKKDRFPLPLIEELLERLVGARVFTKVDLRSGFYQVAMAEDSVQRTAFVTPDGSFEWLAMPMGLCNAPSTFQRLMQKALKGLKFVCIYIDDVLIYSRSFAEHLGHLRVLLEAFREHHLYARLDKCIFATNKITFCGHTVSHNEIRMEQDKVEAVRTWLPPTNVAQLRSFLGFVNFYRKFLRKIADVAAPLNARASRAPSNRPLQLSSSELAAFERLKVMVTEEPMLRMFDPDAPLAIFCDSSDRQAGSFWAQDHGQGWQPGAFESHTLSPAEQRYAPRDKELLVVVRSCKKFRHLVHGRRVIVYTDHESLARLLRGGGTEIPSARLARHLEYLSQFDLDIQYLPGHKQVVADALSRLRSTSLERTQATAALTSAAVAAAAIRVSASDVLPALIANNDVLPDPVAVVTLTPPCAPNCQPLAPVHMAATSTTLQWDTAQRAAWMSAQERDAFFGPIVRALNSKAQAQASDRDSLRSKRFQLINGLLHFREGQRLCVPERLDASVHPRLLLLQEHHDTVSGGHVGVARCHVALARTYYWPRMLADVTKFVGSCRVCQRTKPDLQPARTPLQPLPTPDQRWHTVGMDWITGLPKTVRGYDAILAVTDLTTDRVRVLKAHSSDTAMDTAQIFLEHIYCQHGLPVAIVSDRDPKIVSEFWGVLMGRLGTKLQLTTANHPQADGRSERSNQSVINHLKAFVAYDQSDWDTLLWTAEFAINSHVNTTARFTPFFLDLGREPRTPSDLLGPAQAQVLQSAVTDPTGASGFLAKIQSALQSMRDGLAVSQADLTAQRAGGRAFSSLFRVGDMVMLDSSLYRDPISADRVSVKLGNRFVGPFPVVEVLGPSTVRLDLPPRMRRCHPVVNVSHVKRVASNDFVNRFQPEPGPVTVDRSGAPMFEVERILDTKVLRNRRLYLVQWTGYEEPSWEPASALTGRLVRKLINEFQAQARPSHRVGSRAARQRPPMGVGQ